MSRTELVLAVCFGLLMYEAGGWWKVIQFVGWAARPALAFTPMEPYRPHPHAQVIRESMERSARERRHGR